MLNVKCNSCPIRTSILCGMYVICVYQQQHSTKLTSVRALKKALGCYCYSLPPCRRRSRRAVASDVLLQAVAL